MKTQRKITSDLDQIPKTLVATSNFPMCSSWAHKLKHTNKKHHTLTKMNNQMFDTEIMVNYTKLFDIMAFSQMSFIQNYRH